MDDELLEKIRNVADFSNEEKLELIELLKKRNSNSQTTLLFNAIENFEKFFNNGFTMVLHVVVKYDTYQQLLKNIYDTMQSNMKENKEVLQLLQFLDQLGKKHVFLGYSIIYITKIQKTIDELYAVIPTIK